MRTSVCLIALAFSLCTTSLMAQTSRISGPGGVKSSSRVGGGSSGHHHRGHQHQHGVHHHHGPRSNLWGGSYCGFNRFGFGGNLFYSVGYPNFYYGSMLPYYGSGFDWSTTYYPPYYGGLIQSGSEVPITYLPMRGTAPATLPDPNFPADQVQNNPLLPNGGAGLPAEIERLDPLELVDRPVRRSTLENRLKARQEQIKGDLAFRAQERLKAHGHYKQADVYAEDLASVQFRLAVSYSAMGKFDLAVGHLKRVLELEPDWPEQGETVSRLYGNENVIARNSMLIRLSDWVGQDIRDPDRLFLMGVFLFESSPDKAREFLKSSAQLSGSDRYSALFLQPIHATAGKQTREAPAFDDTLLDSEVPAPPAPNEEAPPRNQRTVPVPPLPDSESSDEIAPGEPSDSTEPYVPKDLGFIHPRHGGGYPLTATIAPVPEGPRFPALGN